MSEDEIIDVPSQEPQQPTQASTPSPVHKPSKPTPKMKKVEKIDWSSQGALVLGGGLFLAIVLYAILGSCRHAAAPKERRVITEASILPAIVDYGGEKIPGEKFIGLEATRSEKNPELVEEIKRIIENGEAPSNIFQDDVPSERNVAVELSNAFKIYKQNPGELDQLRSVVPYGDWNIAPETIQQVGDILTRVDPKRLQIREMLNRDDVCFSFEFLPDDQFGSVPDTEASDYLGDYALMEEFAVARALADGDMTAATESLAYIFRIAQLAAEVKNPGIRTKAAQIRLHAVDVMQGVILNPNFQEKNMAFLLDMLQEQLDQWTPDAAAWVGDRASGMKVYNLIMQYGLEAALEPEEVQELADRGIMDSEPGKLLKNLTTDQVFYLRSMQTVIDECKKPYYQRLTALNRINDQVRMRRGTEEEIIVAEFLLRGIRELMEYCALDRTKCEIAVLAMATSLGRPVATPKRPNEILSTDPLYGKKYEIRRIMNDREPKINVVWVSFFMNTKPFRTPDYGK